MRNLLTILGSIGVFFLSLAPASSLYAKKIPLGINWQSDIFVQEYWQAGKAQYCVANGTSVDSEIQVGRWPVVDAKPLLQWVVAAGATRCVDAQAVVGERLIQFKQNSGARLGLLNGPQRPELPVAEQKVISVKGINGSCNVAELWFAQESIWGKSGQKVRITLMSDGVSTLYFSRSPGINESRELPLLWVFSDTLNVDRSDDQFIIHAAKQQRVGQRHSVELEIELPIVEQPSMFFLSGKQALADNGWQCLMRAILVKP